MRYAFFMVAKAAHAHERFGKAAMKLFREQGYAATTVPQIANAAGLTERTFFRYFVDKPEVLFWRASQLQADAVEAIKHAPAGADTFGLLISALEAVGEFFDQQRSDVIARQALVAAHQSFQERELMKMYSLMLAMAEALEERGTSALEARVSAEAAILVWRLAIEAWTASDGAGGFSHQLRICLEAFQTVTNNSVA